MNKVKYLLFYFLLIIIIFIPLRSEEEDSKISFVAYWSVGDSYDYKVFKTTQQWSDDKLVKDQHNNYTAKFTVLEETDSSYIIKWTYETNLGNNYDIPEVYNDKLSKYNISEIIYKTSELGEFIEILNWNEISEFMNTLFDEMILLMADDDEVKKKALISALLPIKQIYSSREGLEQLAFKELQYLHFPLGLEFDVNEPMTYDDELPNMFGGEPISAIANIMFDYIDYEEKYCSLKHEISIDPNGTKEFLRQFFIQMKFDENEINKALETAVIRIDDRNTFDYFYYPGIPDKIETIRESIFDFNNRIVKRIDKINIEMIISE